MRRVFLIRHGESQANAGLATISPEKVALTSRGHEQARQIAGFLQDYTYFNLIVTSAYLRTKQTAEPTKQAFRNASVEEWEVQEFTYLASIHQEQSTAEERKPLVDAYWEQSQPLFMEGSGSKLFNVLNHSESFKLFIGRVQAFIRRLKEPAYDRYENVAVFSHEQFITAALWLIERNPGEITSETMRQFRAFFNDHRLPNGAIAEVKVRRNQDAWSYETITAHLKRPLSAAPLVRLSDVPPERVAALV